MSVLSKATTEEALAINVPTTPIGLKYVKRSSFPTKVIARESRPQHQLWTNLETNFGGLY